eukprot:g19112.t1
MAAGGKRLIGSRVLFFHRLQGKFYHTKSERKTHDMERNMASLLVSPRNSPPPEETTTPPGPLRQMCWEILESKERRLEEKEWELHEREEGLEKKLRGQRIEEARLDERMWEVRAKEEILATDRCRLVLLEEDVRAEGAGADPKVVYEKWQQQLHAKNLWHWTRGQPFGSEKAVSWLRSFYARTD